MTLHINFVVCLTLDFIPSYCWILANKIFIFFPPIINLRGVDAVFGCFLFYTNSVPNFVRPHPGNSV